jgi:iron complex transport system permease protein
LTATNSAVSDGAAVGAYRRLSARRVAAGAATLAAMLGLLLLDIATGPALLPVGRVAAALLPSLGQTDATTLTIVWTLRLPMACMALAVGAALGISGAAMQTILNNPLASPYTLGISTGAGFGAALAIVAGLRVPVPGMLLVPASAFLFSCVASAAVFGIARIRQMAPEVMVLAGIALLFLFQALQSWLQFIASPEALQAIVFWLFGSLARASWGTAAVVAVGVILALPLLLADAWRLTALRLGDERARGLGVEVGRLRLRVFALVSLLTALSVCFVGTIGFIGLVAPHLARMLVGEDQRYLLLVSGGLGAVLLSAASVASKTLAPGAVFPIGIVTALIGVPFFLALVLRSKRGFW